MIEDIAIIIPTHSGHLPWLRSCLESCKKTRRYLLLVYDNPFWKHAELSRALPTPAVMALADTTLIRPRIYARSVSFSHFWNMVYGLRFLNTLGFKYVFNINGDCIMEKPENFPQIIEMLGDNDLHCLQYEPSRRYCGSMGWLAKTALMLDFYNDFMCTAFMPLGNTEGRFWRFVVEKQLKVVSVVNSNCNFRLPDPDCDWYRILGFRHLHAEHKVRQAKKMLPVEKKYCDCGDNNLYVGKFFDTTIGEYWRTGDEGHLAKWWAKGSSHLAKR